MLVCVSVISGQKLIDYMIKEYAALCELLAKLKRVIKSKKKGCNWVCGLALQRGTVIEKGVWI